MEVAEGLILKVVPYGESQFIVNIFTKDEGYMVMITQNLLARRKSLLPVMQICEIEFLRNERGGLHKLRGVSLLNRVSALANDIERSNYAMLWGGVLATLLREQAFDGKLYDYLCKAIELLECYRGRCMNLTLLFFLRLSNYLGIKPDTESYKRGRVFNLESGQFVDIALVKSGAMLTGPNVAEAIYRFTVMEIKDIDGMIFDYKSFKIIFETILLYYEKHFTVHFDRTALDIVLDVLED